MIYLATFSLPVEREEDLLKKRMLENGGPDFGYLDNPYPCGLFGHRELKDIRFEGITIFYGGNGSGKSTLLNLIAARLELERVAPFNTGEMFAPYAKACQYSMADNEEGFAHRIPDGSRIITSDDIFDYMLAVRANNADISEEKLRGRDEYQKLKYGDTVKFGGFDDYETLRLQVLSRRRSVSRRQFLRQTAGEEVKLNSNGETALSYFEKKLMDDTLYCLDEPENSMSPRMQLTLAEMLESMVRYCGCQFILATHSPFLLSMNGARIYDLDEDPVCVKPWWELENTRIYYEFFKRNQHLFEE